MTALSSSSGHLAFAPFDRPGPPVRGRAIDPAAAARGRQRLIALARLMDNAFEIPGLKVRVGLDPLIGLIPAAGDAITAAVSLYIVWEAARLGATRKQLTMMVGNVALDALVGCVPGLGDVFDIAFKANTRNLAIMGIELGASGTRAAAPT